MPTPMRYFRASDRKWLRYRRTAERLGLSLSEWIRNSLDDVADPILKEQPVEVGAD